MMPAFAIVLPVRDGGHHLREAIDSVRAQTLEGWRLLVLENGSADGTPDLVRGYGDPRIALLPADRPLPIEANWARALPLMAEQGVADDAIVTFIGHDDRFRPGFLAQVAALAERDPGATLLQTPFDLIDADGRLIRPCRPIPGREGAADLAAALCWGTRDSFGTGYAFRLRDYRAVGGFPALPRLLYADHLLFCRLAALGRKVAGDAVGCEYRLHPGSASNSISAAKMNDHAAALHAFVEALRAELPAWWRSDAGRAAVATLIARELSLLETPAVSRMLDPANRSRLPALRNRFDEARGDRPAAAFGPVTGGRARLRRLRLTAAVLRRRLRG